MILVFILLFYHFVEFDTQVCACLNTKLISVSEELVEDAISEAVVFYYWILAVEVALVDASCSGNN